MTRTVDYDRYHVHEVVHLSSVITDMWERHIAESIFVQAEPTLKAKAERITAILAEFYQSVADRSGPE